MKKVLSSLVAATMEDMVKVNGEGVLKAEIKEFSHDGNCYHFGVTSRKYVYATKRITVPFEGLSKYYPFNLENGAPILKDTPVYVGQRVDIPFCDSRVEVIDGKEMVVVTLLDDSELTLGCQEFVDWMA